MDGLETFAKNGDALRAFFSTWPSFHDAEVVDLDVSRGNVYPGEWDDRNVLTSVILKVRVLGATQHGATDRGGDVLVTLRFSDASAIAVNSFDEMLCITGISVSAVPRGAYTDGEPLAPRLDVSIVTGDRVSASLSCLGIEVVKADRARANEPVPPTSAADGIVARRAPPPVLNSARVLAYAFVDDIPYRRWGALYVDGKLLEHVPRLAICANLGKNDLGALLFHCSDEWEVLGTSGADTVPAAKEHAERNYPGASARWVDVNTSLEDALRYYDAETGGLKCSFCGQRPFDLDEWIEGKGAAICKDCVGKYYRAFRDSDPESGDE